MEIGLQFCFTIVRHVGDVETETIHFLFSDPSPNGAQLGPGESLLWPDCTLSPLSPKVESGPVGDPVVCDPMHPPVPFQEDLCTS